MEQLLPDLNTPPPNTCASSPNPASCYQALRPNYAKYPNLGSIGFSQTHGKSSYNALQASLERRLKAGLAVNANYSWSHSLDTASALSSSNVNGGYGMVPSEVSKTEYGNSSLDIRQRIAVTANYQLPFGKNATGVRSFATKGWRANVIEVWTTGVPFAVVNSTNISNTCTNIGDRPNQVGNWALSNPGIGEFFNINAFSAQQPGTLGNERRWALYGPHYRHLDLSLFKVFPINDRANLEFRAESFNLTNTANFAVPNSTLGGASFGAITSMSYNYTPRVLQFALKLAF